MFHWSNYNEQHIHLLITLCLCCTQVAESCELVCDKDGIDVLCDEYQKTDTVYQLKIQVTRSHLQNGTVVIWLL